MDADKKAVSFGSADETAKTARSEAGLPRRSPQKRAKAGEVAEWSIAAVLKTASG
jgi:hypothetical protein